MASRNIPHHLTNVLVASVWGFYAYSNVLRSMTETETETGMPWFVFTGFFLRNTTLALLFLFRRPSKETTHNVKEWLVALCGTFVGFVYMQSVETTGIVATQYANIVHGFNLLIVCWILWSALSLGRSFGIVPANRGIKTTGLYAYVRHPIYSGYLLFDFSMVFLLYLSWRNVAVFAMFITACYLRATYEERLLRRDPQYQDYAKKTRYMFVPGIL